MLAENQVYVQKPLCQRVMFVEEVKKGDDKTTYSATIIDYTDSTITKVVEEETNDLWVDEWWCLVSYEGAWEQELDNFVNCLKEDAARVHKKHEEDVAKDEAFFQSIVGNTYKCVFGERYIMICSFSLEQYFEHNRQYKLGIVSVDGEMGEIKSEEVLFNRNGFEKMYKPCKREEYERAKVGDVCKRTLTDTTEQE